VNQPVPISATAEQMKAELDMIDEALARRPALARFEDRYTKISFACEINSQLLEACERLLLFNQELCQDMNVSIHYPSADFTRKVIAKAKGEA
jgi:hypothetical protein